MVMDAVLKTDWVLKPQEFESLSLRQKNGELTERLLQWFAKPSSFIRSKGSPDSYRDLLSAIVRLADMAYAFDCKSKKRSSNLLPDSI